MQDEPSNQSPPYVDVDLYGSDLPLQAAVAANGGAGADEPLSDFGRHWGREESFDLGRQANENPPRLKAFDARGNRRDIIEFHPAYHRLMSESIAAGLHAATWREDATPQPPPAQVARAARFYMAAQIETGHLCPITMTHAAVAALAVEPKPASEFCPRILSRAYEPGLKPWWEKAGITLGMGMTEKQGGTDVRANTTRATASGDAYSITGHKWFMSAPMSDAFLVLAQAPGGLTCFLMPRVRPDGSVNGLRFQRLKDKLGNRSNASAEVEFVDAFAWRIGDEGRGVRTIINMVQLTRLDCAIASTGLIRMGLAQAIHHARHRRAFQKRLVEQPMMQMVLGDMALLVEAATALVMRLAGAFDRAANDPLERAYARLLTPAVKYWVCKTAPGFLYEAMECLGGNGYVEESALPRLYREAPVNAIWEGSGNVMCLDVLRVLRQEAGAANEIIAVITRDAADLPGAPQAQARSGAVFSNPHAEAHARDVVEALAQLAAAAALRASAPRMAELFARTYLGDRHGALLGTGAMSCDEAGRLIERALPA